MTNSDTADLICLVCFSLFIVPLVILDHRAMTGKRRLNHARKYLLEREAKLQFDVLVDEANHDDEIDDLRDAQAIIGFLETRKI